MPVGTTRLLDMRGFRWKRLPDGGWTRAE
jgi:hypothetical protein